MAETAPVTVYTTPTCPWCDRTKEYLSSRNVPYVVKDVASDYDAAVEMVQRSGQQGVPVTIAGNDVIVGFDQVRLARLAERYAGPKRPALGLLGANASDYFARHPESAAAFGEAPTSGVYVGQVRPNSVAARAGIRPGDVIQAAANKRVRDMRALDQIIESVKAGDAISVRLLRGGEELTLTLDFTPQGGASRMAS
jgi:glutaredoxin-like YruB-family protein